MAERGAAARVAFAAAHIAMAGAAGGGLVLAAGGPDGRGAAVALAALAVLCGIVLRPAGVRAFGTGGGGLSARVACVAAASAVGAATAGAASPVTIAALAGAAAVLGFLFDGLAALIDPGGTGDGAAAAVAGIVLVASAAPVWLGPWVAGGSGPAWMVDGIVWTSPLSYLAAAGGFDYLRSAWFYTHAPFGGLRYALPGLPAATVAYGVLGTLAWIAAQWRARRSSPGNPRGLADRGTGNTG